jgi:outer membrane biosynthesis protein TonB
LLFKQFGVIDVMTAQSAAPRRTSMKTFTIENETNNITLHATVQDAEAVANAEQFRNEAGLAKLAANWPTTRLAEIWNTLPGVAPVKKFTDRKTAVTRIWKAIQGLGERVSADIASEVPEEVAAPDRAPIADETAVTATPEEAVATENSQPLAPATPVAPQTPDVAPTEAPANNEATPTKSAPKSTKAAKAKEAAGPRDGSKTAQVVAMLQRKNGATLSEIMDKMGWQKHTVRGFMADAMKKAGYTVESFKPEGGERTYRINK